MLRGVVLTSMVVLASALAIGGKGGQAGDAWTSQFELDPRDLTSIGRNPYFSLQPGATLVLEAGRERLTVTVLNQTRMIDRVDTRVVEERETKDGALVEISRNYFAISKRTNAVYYFGEEVDIYKDGEVVGHEGAWLAGVKGARAGLMMPGSPVLAAKYYQEIAPGVAMDRAEIVSLNEFVTTPAGSFKDVLKIEETTPLEPGVREYKFFAKGVGLIQDGALKLTLAKQGLLAGGR